MKAFVETGFDRKNSDLKVIRNILIGLISNKAWEILVGQSIAKIARDRSRDPNPNSLTSYLGDKVCKEILKI